MNKIIRAVAYIRVSSDRQAREGDSLREQEQSIKDYVAHNKNMVLVDTYIDDGISGQKIDRGEFQRLLDDVKNDSIDLILFTKLDRWFRNLKHYLNVQEILDQHNVSWIAIRQQQYDTSTAFGRAFVNMSMTWAELEAQNDSERVLAVNANKVKNGETLTGNPPTGYKIENKKYVPDENAEMIKDMFDHFVAHASIAKTRRYLAEEYGFEKVSSTIRKKLKNRIYIGEYRDNPNFCEPLIEKETFEIAQKMLEKNQKINKKHDYVFAGILICKECGHRLKACHHAYKKKNAAGKVTRYSNPVYKCGQHYEFKKCRHTTILFEQKFEKEMVAMIQGCIEQYIVEYEIKTKPIQDNTTKIKKLEKKANRLKDLYINELIELDEYREMKASYDAEIASLLSASAGQSKKDLSFLKKMLKMDIDEVYWTFTKEERNRFWRSFIDKIYIDNNRNVEIIFL